jgi:hypothetical protein
MQSFAGLPSELLTDLQYEGNPFLCSDMDLSSARKLSLISSFFKKNVDFINQDADSRCLELFLSCNSDCEVFKLTPQSMLDEYIIGEVKHIIDDIFHSGPDLTISEADFSSKIGVGPGASQGAVSYNFYSKLFDSPLTYTDDQLPVLYSRAISSNPTWASAEKQRALQYGFRMVEGNRLSFVPKTQQISRAICTEPALNMLFQRGVGLVFEELLRKRFRIDLSTQPDINKRLARQGSLDGTFGTIDLKSASDSVSLELLDQIFPRYVVSWLRRFRSPRVVLPDGSSRVLHMVSSMGNGFTFPLQTLIFASIVRACYRLLGIKPEFCDGKPTNFGVFGDDIVVRKDAYSIVLRALKLFGFVVNDEKSFNTGAFRESCGGDYFRGADIRGVYLKSLQNRTDVYSAINRLVRWSGRSGIPLPSTIKSLSRTVKFLPVPYHAGDTEGVKVPERFLTKRVRDKNGCLIYLALRPVPLLFKAPSGEDERQLYYPRSRKPIGFNSNGLVVSLVGGFIRNGRIGLRDESHEAVRRYKVRRCKTPHWDFYDSAAEKRQVHDWEVMYELLHYLSCFSFSSR